MSAIDIIRERAEGLARDYGDFGQGEVDHEAVVVAKALLLALPELKRRKCFTCYNLVHQCDHCRAFDAQLEALVNKEK